MCTFAGARRGNRLAELVADRGLAALVDDRYALDGDGNAVRVGEDVRALAQLEAAERDRAERMAVSMSKLGINAAAVSVAAERQGRFVVAVAQENGCGAGLRVVGGDQAVGAARDHARPGARVTLVTGEV